jgi:hypothetical protein
MASKLLRLLSQQDGDVVLTRFFDRVRYLDNPPTTPEVSKPTSSGMASKYAELARTYNPENIRQLNATLELIYDHFYAQLDDPEVLAYRASIACELAIFVRERCQLDLCTFTVSPERPPLPSSHPMMMALPLLEKWIEDFFKKVDEHTTDQSYLDDHTKKSLWAASFSRMQAAFIWKSYLSALNKDPQEWWSYEAYALSALKLLSTADPVAVFKFLRTKNEDAIIRTDVGDENWPPPAFAKLYLRYGDLLADRLIGGIKALQRHTQGNLEGLADLARRNSLRKREALDKTQRASSQEKAERTARIRTMDDVVKAYEKMRRDDFCEVVGSTVKAGNLSDADASSALHIREWVRCEGDLRMTFPEWLAGEGTQRLLLLNQEWLSSGADPRTSFEEWWAADGNGKISVSAERARWQLRGNKIVRSYDFPGLPNLKTSTFLRIECLIYRELIGSISTNFRFYVRPYLYLMPDRVPFEDHLTEAPFFVGLFASATGAGTEESPLRQGGLFEVHGCSEDPDTALLITECERDVAQCVKAISTASKLMFSIYDEAADPPVRLRLELQNDNDFKRLYKKLQTSV